MWAVTSSQRSESTGVLYTLISKVRRENDSTVYRKRKIHNFKEEIAIL